MILVVVENRIVLALGDSNDGVGTCRVGLTGPSPDLDLDSLDRRTVLISHLTFQRAMGTADSLSGMNKPDRVDFAPTGGVIRHVIFALAPACRLVRNRRGGLFH